LHLQWVYIVLKASNANFMTEKRIIQGNNPGYHHGNLREAILKAAIDAIGEKGVSQFSLSELARIVGVTPAAAYKHFVDKEALVGELAQHGFAVLRSRFEQAAPPEQTSNEP
jgi:AcrR family transcriptional regulator